MREPVKKAKWPLRLAAFFFACLLMLYGLDRTLAPKADVMEGLYAEPKGSIDVLFLGGSHCAAAFDPLQMWEDYGFTAYNLYSWSQPPWTSYHYILEALKTQKPQVVVMEAFSFLYGNTYLSTENSDSVSDEYSMLMRPSLNRTRLALAMAASQENALPALQYTSLLRWHSRWKYLTAEDLVLPFQSREEPGRGFGPNYTIEAFPQQVRPQGLGEAALYPACEEYLLRMIALAQKEGFALVLSAAPYIVEEDNEWMVYNTIRRICEENGVPFVDYLDTESTGMGFDYATDLAEHAHVNLLGAQKITTHMGAWLAKNYALADKRALPEYTRWYEALQSQRPDRYRAVLRMQHTAAEFLPLLGEEGTTAFLITGADLPAVEPGTPLYEGFAAMGLLPGVPAVGDEPLLAVLDGETPGWLQLGETPAVYTLGGVSIEVSVSAGGASLLVDGENVLLPYSDGVNVVIFDAQSGALVHNVVFRPAEGSITRTD